MTARKAKRHINQSEDFFVLTRVKEIIFVDHKDNDSLNLILDLAVSNPHFLELLKSVIKSVDEYTKQEDSNKPVEDRPPQSEDTIEGEIQEAEVID